MAYLSDINTVNGITAFSGVKFTIGTENTDVANVAVQLLGSDGKQLLGKVALEVWLADASTGILTGTAPATSTAIGTDGTIIKTITSKTEFLIETDVYGKFDLDVTETGTDAWYVVVRNPMTGKLYVSSTTLSFTA